MLWVSAILNINRLSQLLIERLEVTSASYLRVANSHRKCIRVAPGTTRFLSTFQGNRKRASALFVHRVCNFATWENGFPYTLGDYFPCPPSQMNANEFNKDSKKPERLHMQLSAHYNWCFYYSTMKIPCVWELVNHHRGRWTRIISTSEMWLWANKARTAIR